MDDKHDDVVNEFDQTGGKGPEGDSIDPDRAANEPPGVTAPFTGLVRDALGTDDEEDGRTPEERDEAVTPFSEERER